MKKVAAIALAAFVLALAAPFARADHHGCAAPAPCGPAYVEKVVTCYRAEWRERNVTCTITRAVPREVVEDRTCTVMVPEIKAEKRTIWVCKYVSREIEREVTCCRMVSACVTDPCTGCTYTTCKPEYYTHKIKQCIMEPAHEQREITVNVCHYRAEQRKYQVRYTVCDYKPENVTYKQSYCVMVPYQTKVMVPACCH